MKSIADHEEKGQNFYLLNKYGYYLASIYQLLTEFENPLLILRIFTGLAGAGLKQVRLRRSGLTFTVRSPMDVWCLKETHLDRFYEVYGAALQDGWTVVDIGAGLGDFCIRAAHEFPGNRVYAYEPFAESYKLLERNLAANKICNVQIFQQAVGQTGALLLDLSGGEPLQITSHQPGCEGLSTANPGETNGRTQQVTSLALNEVFVQNGIQRCDLLKMDCEGAEYDILLNAKAEALGRVQRLVMEYHDSITSFTHLDLVALLTAHGFTVSVTPNAVHPDIGYLFAHR